MGLFSVTWVLVPGPDTASLSVQLPCIKYVHCTVYRRMSLGYRYSYL